ncbi:UDP-N-acetylglucosamine--N-acetylmuramyl-(pentapeptide) pyrophosphoryl-undecaprenol N-acetylglucosamine transferase [Micromonospora polyrhachis]|uniref:UDP-N-acetylglucosamine--N-acetylmuramyl-(pentapeptide) pyrophosphoryl-undecaprenol N-acetylglucosamine transferase n=1 Tax=Micromonospora polyrhachis TaxID=1282883 RepID=A0A7W7WSA6_9ACTN|nr:UDP-N-acetylglucosamine--N-acetylmuramyl-(pentapeptide) pyrophosphoryl-undecaprenol N-acetylglucosamine transferase [Micromonospora polyrhachis]MBB4962056.1 UDP-N-acetylglucosamine--N-acetylmuramyl-(pentapeptide) pyrophosphoryl-undecaprenol N-acetylglucosamine transferase [Micromonospora polyrhachis]
MTIYSAEGLHRIRVIVTGGGTGGHTYPALTTIRTLRARLAEAGTEPELLWVGVSHGLEAKIARQENVPFKAITTGKLRRSPNLRELGRNLADMFRIPLGVVQAIMTVIRTKPAVVFSTGGYVCVPIGVAAWLTRRPLVMHEQILTLGLANRILARLATRILLSHESSVEHLPARAKRRAVVTGNPVRPEVLAGNRAAALAAYGLDPDLPLVFVTGGAQGALQVNKLVAAILPDILPGCQVLHQCGDYSFAQMREVAAGLPDYLRNRYRVVDYVHGELPDVLAAADIVVARSGAGTVAELTALGKACIFIPLIPTGGDEQRRTARHLADAGAARMLAGPDATADRLRDEVIALLKDPRQRQWLADNARQHGRPDAATAVARQLIDAARRD